MSTTSLSSSMSVAAAPGTVLHGNRLLTARILWCAIFVASVLTFVALVPLNLSGVSRDWQIVRSALQLGILLYHPSYDTYALYYLVLRYLALFVFLGIAGYIFWRASDDWMAILVSIALLTLPHAFNFGGYVENWYSLPTPLDLIFRHLDDLLSVFGLVITFALFFVFPDGRFVPRWTRWIVAGVCALAGWLTVSSILDIPMRWDEDAAWVVLLVVVLAIITIGAGSQIYRYQGVSSESERRQTRVVVIGWVGFSVIFLIRIITFLFEGLEFPLGYAINLHLDVLVPMVIPLSFGIAMMRDQLWATERVLNRALVYGTLTLVILVLYGGLVAILNEVFRASSNLLSALVATAIAVVLIQPLSVRVQRAVNRLTYGERDDPVAVMARLGTGLENAGTPDHTLRALVETVAQALKLPYAAIFLDGGGDDRVGGSTGAEAERSAVAAYGKANGNTIKFRLSYQSQRIGELVVSARSPREKLSTADMGLLETIARQAGAVAYAARVTEDLRRSRERIVTAREEERRRVRRDLHDGLGPTLASQALKLDAALELLGPRLDELPAARKLLVDVKTQTQTLVADIRRLVYALRPPALDELGLIGALQSSLAQEEYSSQGLKLALSAPPEGLPTLSAAVEVAAFRIVLEAVTNIVQHARAQNGWVNLAVEGGSLVVEVRDDGAGLAPGYRSGVGLASMRERAEELGGTIIAESAPGKGTRVEARLPL